MKEINLFLCCLVTTWAVSCVAKVTTTDRKYPLEVHQMFQTLMSGGRKATSGVGTWTSWSSWTPCTRTCGGGIATQTRDCDHRADAKRRRRVAVDDAVTSHMKSHCVGVYKRFHVCNDQTCLAGSKDFRQLQCEAFNRKQFMGRIYYWEPFLDGKNQCELNCRPVGYQFYATLNKTVVDGTSCRGAGAKGRFVCIAGQCKHVGCDGVVGSGKLDDACGVCGGDNSTCRLVSGLFTRPQLPVGYNLIAQVPRGACNLSISELKQSKNYLALRRLDGTYIINGNWAINWSGEFEALGTKFSYKRQDATVGESVVAAGPLSEPVDLMVIYQQLNPGIKYEYMLPMSRGPVPRYPVPAPPLLGGPQQPLTPPLPQPPQVFARDDAALKEPSGSDLVDSRRPDNVLYPYGVLGTDTQGQGRSLNHHVTAGGDDKPLARGKLKRRKFTWKVTEYSKCSRSCGGGLQTGIVLCVREHNNQLVPAKRCSTQEKPIPQTLRCNAKPCLAEWVGGEWSACSVTCGDGIQHRDIMCKQEITQTLTLKVAEGACLSPLHLAKTQPCLLQPCSDTQWQAGAWGVCSATCGTGTRSRTVQCLSSRLEDCLDVDRPRAQEPCQADRDCSDKLENASWLFTDWTGHCSEACGTGVQTRRVVCTGICEPANRPEESRACSSDKQCSGKWFAGPWGHCSSRCGPGRETRNVICVAFLRGQHRVTADASCPTLLKPEVERGCEVKSCSHEWFTSDWTQCSKECGNGMQWRDVKCLDEKTRNSEECSETHEPSSRRTCNAHHCSDQHKPQPSHLKSHTESQSPSHHRVHTESQSDPVVLSVDDQAQPGSIDDDGSDCQDRFPNCHLVVQSRLCRYKYYRNSCCISCENKP